MTALPAPPISGITAVEAPRQARRALMLALTVHFALCGPVQVLDGGNCFEGLKLARALRARTRRYHGCLQRVSVARAFTCDQMTSLLARAADVTAIPTVVLEPLATFEDENVPYRERGYLVGKLILHLKRMGLSAPVFISMDRETTFFDQLIPTASRHWQFAAPAPAMVQGRLF